MIQKQLKFNNPHELFDSNLYGFSGSIIIDREKLDTWKEKVKGVWQDSYLTISTFIPNNQFALPNTIFAIAAVAIQN